MADGVAAAVALPAGELGAGGVELPSFLHCSWAVRTSGISNKRVKKDAVVIPREVKSRPGPEPGGVCALPSMGTMAMKAIIKMENKISFTTKESFIFIVGYLFGREN